MPLVMNEQILGDLIREIQSRTDWTLSDETCLDLIATGFGLPSPLALLAAVSDEPIPVLVPREEHHPPVLAFWKSGMLNSFITDYASSRQPIIVVLSGYNSIVVIASKPPKLVEIKQDQHMIVLNELGPLPLTPDLSGTILGRFDTPERAFDTLCQWNNWEWLHSSSQDVR